jgi:hypothetical protein
MRTETSNNRTNMHKQGENQNSDYKVNGLLEESTRFQLRPTRSIRIRVSNRLNMECSCTVNCIDVMYKLLRVSLNELKGSVYIHHCTSEICMEPSNMQGLTNSRTESITLITSSFPLFVYADASTYTRSVLLSCRSCSVAFKTLYSADRCGSS